MKTNSTYANIKASATAKEKCVRGIVIMIKAMRLGGNISVSETMRIRRRGRVVA